MNKITFLLVSICINSWLHAQEILYSKEFGNTFEPKQTILIDDTSSGDLAIFYRAKSGNKCQLFSENLELKDSIEVGSLPNKYNRFLGDQIGIDGSYQLFFATSKKNLITGLDTKPYFGFINLSFSTRESSIKELDLELAKEQFMGTFTLDHRLIIITVENKSNVLNFYRFNDAGNHEKVSVNCDHLTFRNWDNSKTTLFNLLNPNFGFGAPLVESLIFFDEKFPYSINSTSALNKLYVKNGEIILTFEAHKSFTQVLTIDTNNSWSANLNGFMKPSIESSSTGSTKKSNSFLFDNKFFGITILGNQIKFEIKDYFTKKLINSFTIQNHKAIDVKDSPIKIVKELAKGYKETEDTSKFFKKFKIYGIGLSVNKFVPEGYQITLGCAIPEGKVADGNLEFNWQDTGTSNVNGLFRASGFSYSYTSGVSVAFIDCLFDSNFNDIDGTPRASIYEQIESFTGEQEKIVDKFIDTFQDYVLLGCLDKNNLFTLTKFEK